MASTKENGSKTNEKTEQHNDVDERVSSSDLDVGALVREVVKGGGRFVLLDEGEPGDERNREVVTNGGEVQESADFVRSLLDDLDASMRVSEKFVSLDDVEDGDPAAPAGPPSGREAVIEYLSNLSMLKVVDLIDALKERWRIGAGPIMVADPFFSQRAARAENARHRTRDKLSVKPAVRVLEFNDEALVHVARRMWFECLHNAGIEQTLDEDGRFAWPPDTDARIKAYARDVVGKLTEEDLHRARIIGMLEVRRDRLEEWSHEVSDLKSEMKKKLYDLANALRLPLPRDADELSSYARELYSQRLYGRGPVESLSKFERALNILRGGNGQNWTGAALRELREAIERHVDNLIGDRLGYESPLQPETLVFHFTSAPVNREDVKRILSSVAPNASVTDIDRIHEVVKSLDSRSSWRRAMLDQEVDRLSEYLVGRFGGAFAEYSDLKPRVEKLALLDAMGRQEDDEVPRVIPLISDILWHAEQRARKGYEYKFPIRKNSRRAFDKAVRDELLK